MEDLKIHPMADSYPLHSDEDLQRLAADIEANGQQDPIVYSADHVLLDGRNRLAACKALRIQPRVEFKTFDGDSQEAADFVESCNLRRSMTKDQEVMRRVRSGLGRVSATQAAWKRAQELFENDHALALAVLNGERGLISAHNAWLRSKGEAPERKKYPAAAPSGLLDFATPEDRAIIENAQPGAVEAIKRTRKTAAARGWAPEYGWTNAVPAPHVAKGVSSLHRRGEPEPVLQWVKSSLSDQQMAELQQQYVQRLSEHCAGLGPLPELAVEPSADLCNVFVLGDPHFGMLAWARETLGENFDLETARSLHVQIIRRLVADAPAAETAVLALMGDNLHTDNYDFLTQSGHRLDADSRYPRVIDVACDTLQAVGDAVLQRHENMNVKVVSGNHDRNATPWLQRVLREYWRHSDRVEVDASPAMNLKYRFGKVLCGFTHGDNLKGNFKKRKPYAPQEFLSVMANDWSKDWGETEHRYGMQGHIHSSNKVEGTGGSLESFQTLAALDAWHASKVYRSGKSMTRITLHREFGEIGRGRVPVEMVR